MNSQQLYNLVGEDNIFHVDGLCFCAHGYEYCNTCYTDLRSLNQMHVFPDQKMDSEGWDRNLVSLIDTLTRAIILMYFRRKNDALCP